MRALPKGAKVLDVGCGKGTFLAMVHTERPDIETYGADIGEVEE